MKLKAPTHAPRRRALLKSLLDRGVDQASTKSLNAMMKGFKQQGDKPSTGTRPAPRGRLTRQKTDSAMTSLDSHIDRMIAQALTGGPQTTGVLSSLFGLTPNLTGR